MNELPCERPHEPGSTAQSRGKNGHVPRSLLVALHDVAPVHADRLEHAERLFDEIGIEAVSYLLVPNYHGHCPADQRADFVAWCRERRPWRVQWFLHGHFHREEPERQRGATLLEWCGRTFLTDGEGEFLTLRGRALDARLRAGIETFERCLGESPTGFVAPAWLYNDDLFPALRRARVSFTESHFHVFDMSRDRPIRAPVVTWASRSRAHRIGARLASAAGRRLWRDDRVVRIALHPGDFDHRRIVDSIRRTIDALRAGRNEVVYDDLSA